MESTNTVKQNITGTSAKKAGVVRFYPKSLAATVLLLFLCFIEYKFHTTYIDEGLAVACVVIMLFSAPRLTQRDIITLFILITSVLVGLMGNVVYNINESVFSVLVDVLSQLKMPLAFYATKYALSEKEKQQTINMLVPIAVVFLLVNALLAIVSQIVSTPFVSTERYGLKMYTFVFSFAHQYATVAFVMVGVIVCCNTIPKKKKNVYTAIGLIAAVATLKSFSVMFTVIFLALSLYFQKANRVNLKFIIPMAVLIVALSSYQINTYLTEEGSPRRLFIDYAIVNANDHFPLGSGFGTFGSSEAAKNYSKLYYEYGFNMRWGMTPDNPSFLVDTYWPTVFGQLGWIGATIYIAFYVRLFLTLGFATRDKTRKAYLYALFSQYMIHAIGSAILQSSTGMIGFMMMAICTTVDTEKENTHNKLHIHIKT